MISQLIDEIYQARDVRLHEGAAESAIAEFERDGRFLIPTSHKAILLRSNGFEMYGGYIRLFGVNTRHAIDAITWNRTDTWKFAWGDRCSKYWCIGETAWGDQYAYSCENLSDGNDAAIYFLDALSMTPHVVGNSFADFLRKEFIPWGRAPYDTIMVSARQKFGPLDIADHLVYVPSILLGGTENLDNVQKMNARAAMICNGDIAQQVDAAPVKATVRGVEPYKDELDRTRIRLVWG